ncbi:hypothetical protein [Marinomonas sp. THO17]|uniref:hypothetical protein n=1 Tax=Marinomonas sp. THO17 TaxID=3149048 RepID=UPI00336C2E16
MFWVWLTACSDKYSHQATRLPLDKRLSLIQTHLLLGQFSLAKQELERIKEADQLREYWRLSSLYWLTLKDFEMAEKVSKEGLKRYPMDAFLLNNYGVLLGTKKHWKEACELFQQAEQVALLPRQSVQINLSRCALRQEDVNLAKKHIVRAKEIADLPVIGLLTELNLVLIQGNNDKARIIFNNIQAQANIALGWAHFNEFTCLSKYINRHEDDAAQYSYASDFTCLNGSRY